MGGGQGLIPLGYREEPAGGPERMRFSESRGPGGSSHLS